MYVDQVKRPIEWRRVVGLGSGEANPHARFCFPEARCYQIPHPVRYEFSRNCRSSELVNPWGVPGSPRINDIPIVRYWAQAPDGKSTKHCIAAALDLLRTCRHAFLCQGGAWGEGVLSVDGNLSRMPPFQDPGQRSIGIARFMGLLRGTCSPANATSPCGRPVLASDDRRTSQDGIRHKARLA